MDNHCRILDKSLAYYRLLIITRRGGGEAELKSNKSQLQPLKKIRGLTVSSYWLAAEFPLF